MVKNYYCFCDLCGKETTELHFDISIWKVGTTEKDEKIEDSEVCKDCYDKIKARFAKKE